MPPAAASQVVVVDDTTPSELMIHWWPLRDEPLSVAIVVAVVAAVGIGAGVISSSAFVGLASAAALTIALRDYLLPADFHLNELGVKKSTFGHSRRTPWREIADYRVGKQGIMLLADRDAGPLNNMHGIYVPYRGERTALVALVEYYLPGSHQTTTAEGLVRQHSD